MCLQIIGGGSWQKNQSRAKYDLSLGPVFQPKRIAIWLILQRSKWRTAGDREPRDWARLSAAVCLPKSFKPSMRSAPNSARNPALTV